MGGGGAGLIGGFADADDVAGDVLGSNGGLLHISGDFAGGGTLLFNGGGNGCGDCADFVDGLADAVDCGYRVLGCGLDLADFAAAWLAA